MSRLISVSELSVQDLSNYVVLFASMTNPVSGKADDPADGFIPGAIKFDIDGEGSDHSGELPHTLLSPTALADLFGRLGISPDSNVLIYDNSGMFSAPRVWWMLKSLGHEKAAILNGGLPAWKNAGNEVVSQLSSPNPTTYDDNVNPHWFCGSATVIEAIDSGAYQILDARSAGRFNGTAPEPRAGLRSGHMPGAASIPFTELLDDNVTLKSTAELTAYFAGKEIDLTRPLLCSCGSGVTACVVGLAALEAGAEQVVVYDGSWSEWGANAQFPVEVTHD